MTRARGPLVVVCVLLSNMSTAGAALADETVAVAVPARAGAVEGASENSDAFVWRLFTQEIVVPVQQGHASSAQFETWASDADTFSPNPHWPNAGAQIKLRTSFLEALKTFNAGELPTRLAAKIDVPCSPPRGAAVGAFPISGTPKPCVAEQVARNRAQFDYIVTNNLNTKAGLAAAYAKSLKVEMPVDSVAVKADWVPLPALLQWIPKLGSIDNVRKSYYTTTVSGIEYGLVAMHVSSRQNPSWVWGTFEHQMNPGRCDYIGCFDTFGAQIPAVQPNRTAVNTQYGACPKTQRLKKLMASANVLPIWESYCLKSTEVDFTTPDGTPYVLGNSVIEGIVGNGTVAASSCISCHAYASFGPQGTPTDRALAILPFNPTGRPIPGVLDGSMTFAFMWGIAELTAK